MAFTDQQSNRTTRLITALRDLKDAYYQLKEDRDEMLLIGIPGAADFPAPGDLNHVTRSRLQNAAGLVALLETHMTTPAVLAAGNNAKSPLDAIIEILR